MEDITPKAHSYQHLYSHRKSHYNSDVMSIGLVSVSDPTDKGPHQCDLIGVAVVFRV